MEKPDPLYQPGDYVVIDQIYVIEGTLKTVHLEEPIAARIVKNKGHTSLGYAYVLSIPEAHRPANHAKVCYWEDHIVCKTEDPDELLWRIWGDQ